jgi:sugar phosphate permease
VLAPALRHSLHLSLSRVGVVLAAEWIGTSVTLLPWGILADRVGERLVLGLGLAGCAGFLAAAAFAHRFASLVVLLALAGAAGASVNSASGRAVMHWFGEEERGLALGIRQTAIPIGGLIGAIALPIAVAESGLEAAFLVLAGVSLAGAVAGVAIIREGVADGVEPDRLVATLRDARLWRVCLASGFYLVAQVAIIGFAVLFLHDERGFSTGEGAALLAVAQVLAATLRIGAGRWSDLLGARLVPLGRIGLVTTGAVALVAALVHSTTVLLLPALAVAGGFAMAWNGLSFTAAAELAGRARSGAAIGFQQTVLSLVGVGAPVAFAAAVSGTSWRVAFLLAALCPLVGSLMLRPLATRERTSARTRVVLDR